MMIDPNESDILLGRGGKNNRNKGNELLRQLSRTNALKYARSSKTKKADIIDSLLSQISQSKPKVRFLLQNKTSGKWELANNSTAREKVSQGLRDAARRNQKNKDISNNGFPVEYHSGTQGLPGYYEEEDCFVIGSFKSYKTTNVYKEEELPYYSSEFGKSLRRVSANIAPQPYPLKRKENLSVNLDWGQSSQSKGSFCNRSVESSYPSTSYHYHSQSNFSQKTLGNPSRRVPEQLSRRIPEQLSTCVPEQLSIHVPELTYNHAPEEEASVHTPELTSTHTPEPDFRHAPEQAPSPYSGSTVSSQNSNPDFVSHNDYYDTPQVQYQNRNQGNERKRSISFFGQDDRTESFRNVKRSKPSYEYEPVPLQTLQKYDIAEPALKKHETSTPDEIEILLNQDDLENFDFWV